MTALIFDTLKLSKLLRSDFTPEQADALASALSTSAYDTIATKAGIQELRAEIVALKGATKADLVEFKAATKSDILELKVDLVRWIVTAIAFNFVATAGLFLGFAKLFAK
ncbi:hypothetical protein [Beijerinckia sp. L45]|uniref:hypothetical protein n=1 Tax=Beijerinckia sp. L45 TaxID=1641855 RepID=UPI00131D3CD1|nr:hypothetical protein [Beijerinckia sp. L45]